MDLATSSSRSGRLRSRRGSGGFFFPIGKREPWISSIRHRSSRSGSYDERGSRPVAASRTPRPGPDAGGAGDGGRHGRAVRRRSRARQADLPCRRDTTDDCDARPRGRAPAPSLEARRFEARRREVTETPADDDRGVRRQSRRRSRRQHHPVAARRGVRLRVLGGLAYIAERNRAFGFSAPQDRASHTTSAHPSSPACSLREGLDRRLRVSSA